MANLSVDLNDIFFNLFKYLGIQKNEYDLGEPEIKGIIDEYLKFVSAEVFEHRQTLDHDGIKLVDGNVVTPEYLKPLTKSYYENGWFAIGCSDKVEGVPAPEPLVVTLDTLLMAANAAYSLYPNLSKSAMNLILAKGNENQKSVFVPKMMEGSWGGTMCLTEAGAGSDVGALRSTATPIGNGKFLIKGEKIFISSGESDLYENNIHLVLARTPEGVKGSKGISLFIVPRFKVDEHGAIEGSNDVKCSKIEEKMGIHGSATCALSFGLEGKCEGELLGEEFSGMANMFHMMNEARLLCGNQGAGQANLAYELTKKYALERTQFGSEIAHLPDVKRMLLKMRSMCRALTGMSMYIANLLEKEKLGDHGVSKEIAFLTPIFKVMGTERAFEVATDAVQVHGGYGYCSEYGIEQFVRDIKITTIYEGTTGIQSLDFVNRKILSDQGELLTSKLNSFQVKVDSLDNKKWPEVKQQLVKVLKLSHSTMELLGCWAKEKNQARILEHCNGILEIFGRVFMTEVLLDQALIAEKIIESANPDEKTYLETKVFDVSYFVQMHLSPVFAFYEQIAYNATLEDLAIS